MNAENLNPTDLKDEVECDHQNRTYWQHWHVGWIEKCVNCGKEW